MCVQPQSKHRLMGGRGRGERIFRERHTITAKNTTDIVECEGNIITLK